MTEELQPNRGGRTIVKEKVDVIEVEYAARGAVSDYTQFAKVDSLLEPLLTFTGGNLKTLRV